jgi:hypothetical protein
MPKLSCQAHQRCLGSSGKSRDETENRRFIGQGSGETETKATRVSTSLSSSFEWLRGWWREKCWGKLPGSPRTVKSGSDARTCLSLPVYLSQPPASPQSSSHPPHHSLSTLPIPFPQLLVFHRPPWTRFKLSARTSRESPSTQPATQSAATPSFSMPTADRFCPQHDMDSLCGSNPADDQGAAWSG